MEENHISNTKKIEKKIYTNPVIIYKIINETALDYCLKIIQFFLDKQTTEQIYVEDLKLITEKFNIKSETLKLKKNSTEIFDKITDFDIKSSQPDLCIVIGGDGTILWANHLFQNQRRPPFLAFNLGTLGYMATYCSEGYINILNDLFNPECNLYLEKRTFLKTRLLMKKNRRNSINGKFDSTTSYNSNDYEIDENEELDGKIIYGLNDITIERKEYTHMIETMIYYNNEPLTLIKSNGVIISTPTGSTAYSLSAGGTIMHNEVDCMILNSICPHSLSFRSIGFPRGDKLKIILANDSKDAVVINDGINSYNLTKNQGVEVEISDKHVDFLLLEKFFLNRSNLWKQKIINQLGWNNSFKNVECKDIELKN